MDPQQHYVQKKIENPTQVFEFKDVKASSQSKKQIAQTIITLA